MMTQENGRVQTHLATELEVAASGIETVAKQPTIPRGRPARPPSEAMGETTLRGRT